MIEIARCVAAPTYDDALLGLTAGAGHSVKEIAYQLAKICSPFFNYNRELVKSHVVKEVNTKFKDEPDISTATAQAVAGVDEYFKNNPSSKATQQNQALKKSKIRC
jgi:hypothetical protein